MQCLVIGAGLVGAFISHQLANRGHKVTVVDAHKAAQGATSRTVGLATPVLSREHLTVTAKGVETIANTALRLGVTPQECHVLHVAGTSNGTDALHRLYESLRGGPAKLVWETGPGAIPSGYTGGIVVQNGALIDLPALTTKLLQHPAIAVYEDVEIDSLESHSGYVSALTREHTIRADVIVIAANTYAGILSPYLAESTRVIRGVMWASRPLDHESALLEHTRQVIPFPIVIDHTRVMMALTQDGRLHMTAWQWEDASNDDPSVPIRQFLHDHLPELLHHSEEWRIGTMSATPDGIPIQGRLAGDGTILYALGAGPYGTAWAPVMAERIQDLLEG